MTKVAVIGAGSWGTTVANVSKGIAQGTFKTMTQVLNDVLDGNPLHHVGVLAGPNIAKEVAVGEPALLDLAASKDVQMPIAEEVGHVLHDGKTARQAVVDLMARPPRVEPESFGLVEAGVDIVYSA